jgi:hypothetical protein
MRLSFVSADGFWRAAAAAHPQADHDTKTKLLKHLIEAFVAGELFHQISLVSPLFSARVL